MASVKQLRESKNMSQEELAREAGVSSTTVSRLESGHPVNKATLKHLARALGVRPETITGVTFSKRAMRRN